MNALDFDIEIDRQVEPQPKPHDVCYLQAGIVIDMHEPCKHESVTIRQLSYKNVQNLYEVFKDIIYEQMYVNHQQDEDSYYRSVKHQDEMATWEDYGRQNHYNDDLDMDQQSQEYWNNL